MSTAVRLRTVTEEDASESSPLSKTQPAFSSDTMLRKRACIALKRYYPYAVDAKSKDDLPMIGLRAGNAPPQVDRRLSPSVARILEPAKVQTAMAQIGVSNMNDRNWPRRIHEFAFSLNLVLGVVLGVVFGYQGVFVPLLRLEVFIYHRLGFKGGGGAVAGYSAFFSCVMVLTVPLFLLLWRFRKTAVATWILVHLGGFLALSVAPCDWLLIRPQYPHGWYPAEIVAYLLFAMLYLRRENTIPIFIAIPLVAFHCGFWYLRYWEYPHSPVELLAPAVGFCACLAWGNYVSKARTRVKLASPVTA